MEIVAHQRIPYEAELEELEKRMRLTRLNMLLLARTDSSISQKHKNSRRNLFSVIQK